LDGFSGHTSHHCQSNSCRVKAATDWTRLRNSDRISASGMLSTVVMSCRKEESKSCGSEFGGASTMTMSHISVRLRTASVH
jgi:hypothetical protein